MDDILNDFEAGIPSNISRSSNKKMKKRKQLDALLKFRLSKNQPNDALRSSEDELFLPHQRTSTDKLHPFRLCRWWKYSQYILSFSLFCIFLIVCVGLSYANVELKTEVQNLSSRINEIEKKFSSIEFNHLVSAIEQIKTRLNLVERWNISFIYDQLQKLQSQSLSNNDNDVSSRSQDIQRKSTESSEVLDTLNQEADIRSKNMINESVIEWYEQLNSLRVNDIQNVNQSIQIQELSTRFEQLTELVYNSSDKTSLILTQFQSDLDKLRSKIEECKCSKEPIHLKPSVVDSNQLQQSIVTKPNTVDSPSPSTSASEKLTNEKKHTEKIEHKNEIDIEQIVNQPSIAG